MFKTKQVFEKEIQNTQGPKIQTPDKLIQKTIESFEKGDRKMFYKYWNKIYFTKGIDDKKRVEFYT